MITGVRITDWGDLAIVAFSSWGTYVLGGLLGAAGSYVGVRHWQRVVSF